MKSYLLFSVVLHFTLMALGTLVKIYQLKDMLAHGIRCKVMVMNGSENIWWLLENNENNLDILCSKIKYVFFCVLKHLCI